jgi:hypothetical protein
LPTRTAPATSGPWCLPQPVRYSPGLGQELGRLLWENGLFVELEAYRCQVFVDWRQVQDNEWGQYAHLSAYLNGRGVPSIEEALQEVFLQPIHQPFRELVNPGAFRWLLDNRVTAPAEGLVPSPAEGPAAAVALEMEARALRLLNQVKQFAGRAEGEAPQPEAIAAEIRHELEACLQLPTLADRFALPRSRKYKAALQMLQEHLDTAPATWPGLLAWLFLHPLGKVVGKEGFAQRSRSWMDEWLLGKIVAGLFQELGLDSGEAWRTVGIVKILVNHQQWHTQPRSGGDRPYQVLVSWLRDSEVQQFLQFNRYRGVLWFNQESFDQLLRWMLAVAAIQISADPERTAEAVARDLVACYEILKTLQRAEAESQYQVVKLMDAAQGRSRGGLTGQGISAE